MKIFGQLKIYSKSTMQISIFENLHFKHNFKNDIKVISLTKNRTTLFLMISN